MAKKQASDNKTIVVDRGKTKNKKSGAIKTQLAAPTTPGKPVVASPTSKRKKARKVIGEENKVAVRYGMMKTHTCPKCGAITESPGYRPCYECELKEYDEEFEPPRR